ncbi:hypothetical protein MEX01_44060 [Methylorubrum extorquens]|nr:hypothetical protein MEX01_44060 [Methylorubrum extorquens]
MPPKVAVPRLSTGTLRPERPNCRYSMSVTPLWLSGNGPERPPAPVLRRPARPGNAADRAGTLQGANGAAAIIPPSGARGSATERGRFRKDFVNQEPLLKLKF